MSAPWMKFYPRDWRGDQALRAVSIASRGLWMEMLCIMHEASPYGHLILGGQPVSNDVLARMAGTGVDEVSALLIDLESAGVFSRTRKGVIYSRRMVKDRSRAEKGRKAVNKRWGQEPDNKGKIDVPNRLPSSKPTTQKPEARYSVSNDTGEPPSLSEVIWGDGLRYLVGTGMAERNARSQLGKWRGKIGEPAVVAALAHCQAKSISDPNTYFEGICRGKQQTVNERQEFLRRQYGEAQA